MPHLFPKYTNPTLLLAVALLLGACAKDTAPDCFKRNGKTVTETRFPGQFNKVRVTDKIEVVIHRGAQCMVQVTTGDALQRKIRTVVENGELLIEDKNRCGFVRGYKHQIRVHVTLPYIALATNQGVSDLIFEDGFAQDTLRLRLEGVGDIKATGTFTHVSSSTHGNGDTHLGGNTGSLAIYANGTGFVRAKDLKVDGYAYIASESVGDVELNGDGLDLLDFVLHSKGNLICYGTPGQVMNRSEAAATGQFISR